MIRKRKYSPPKVRSEMQAYHEAVYICCHKKSKAKVIESFMKAGYGVPVLKEQSSISVMLVVSHAQLDTPANLQEHLQELCNDRTIIVRPYQ